SQVCDIAVGADLLALDVDRAYDLVERSVRQVRGLRDRQIVHLGPKRAEALPLGDPPAGKARRLRVGPADVDVDSADLERARAVYGQDSAIPALQLAVKHSRKSEIGRASCR